MKRNIEVPKHQLVIHCWKTSPDRGNLPRSGKKL